MKHVTYEYGGYSLRVDDGVEFRSDDMGEGFIAAVDDARDVSLTALRDALSRHAKNRAVVVREPGCSGRLASRNGSVLGLA
jgi:hypothetical protein